MTNEQLISKVVQKMKKEYNDYVDKISILSPKEIIDKSYETVYKYEILEMFECDECGIFLDPVDEQMPYEELLAMDNPLEFLYSEWLKWDGSVLDELERSIRYSLGVERFIPSSLGG